MTSESGLSAPDCLTHQAERFYEWWEVVWDARERSSISARDTRLSATVEYGPLELSTGGEYRGYTPVDLRLEPVAGVALETTLERARTRLAERFERWHADVGRRGIVV